MSETYAAAAAAAATRTFPAWPAFSQFKPALVCFQTPADGSFKHQAEHASLAKLFQRRTLPTTDGTETNSRRMDSFVPGHQR